MSTKKDKFSSKDKNYMRLALNLARARKGLTGENPSVGCVIVKNDKLFLLVKQVIMEDLMLNIMQ
jgi:diaminohydroxyphosphoribosylaminopyrimidine deaminase/5-amino-6-(5-phosphoribosylamino)uracil reductase